MTRWPPRPRLGRAYYEAHGLGNDYVVFEEGDDWEATPEAVALVCDPHRGVGSDGVVALLADRSGGVHRARMFNPDGGEFERSGNGLRVLGGYLCRRGDGAPYRISVGGDEVTMWTHDPHAPGVHDLSVEMGRARTGAEAVDLDPNALDTRGRIAGPDGAPLEVVPVRIGNPHMVVLGEEPADERLAVLGPFLVAHPALAHGANVQIAHPTGPDRCRLVIWERGVGPTSASGTSACAVAVAMVASGRLAPGEIGVDAPGGSLRVRVDPALEVVLRGPVEEICEGRLADAFLAALARAGGGGPEGRRHISE